MRKEHGLSFLCQVIFVGVSDAFDEFMGSETADHSGDFATAPVRKPFLEGAVGEPADVVFSSYEGVDESPIIGLEEVDSPVTALLPVADRLADVVEFSFSRSVILHLADVLVIAVVTGSQQFGNDSDTVDCLLHGGVFHFSLPVAFDYLAVVFEK